MVRLRRILEIFILVALLPVTANAFTFAETSYRLLRQSCPQSKAQPPKEVNFSTPATCSAYHTDEQLRGLLRSSSAAVSKDAYLASLAQERSKSLNCAVSQLSEATSNPEKMNRLIDRYIPQIQLLGEQKRTMARLEPLLATDATARAEYKKARLAAQGALLTLPFSKMQSMRMTIDDLTGPDEPTPDYMRTSLRKTLEMAQRTTVKEKQELDQGVQTFGRTLSNSQKESLAQDTDLIETFRKKNPDLENTLQTVSCQTDAEYGLGAKYRDNALMIALFGATVIFTGGGTAPVVPSAGATALATSVTAGVATGAVPLRAAGLLRYLSFLSTEATVSLTQAMISCQKPTVRGQVSNEEAKNGCDVSLEEMIEENNCLLNTGLTALGIRSAVKGMQQASTKAAKARVATTDEAKAVSRTQSSTGQSASHFSEFIGPETEHLLKGLSVEEKSQFIRSLELAKQQIGADKVKETIKKWSQEGVCK